MRRIQHLLMKIKAPSHHIKKKQTVISFYFQTGCGSYIYYSSPDSTTIGQLGSGVFTASTTETCLSFARRVYSQDQAIAMANATIYLTDSNFGNPKLVTASSDVVEPTIELSWEFIHLAVPPVDPNSLYRVIRILFRTQTHFKIYYIVILFSQTSSRSSSLERSHQTCIYYCLVPKELQSLPSASLQVSHQLLI